MNKTKTYTMRINFFWDDGDDMQEFTLTVPENITAAKIEEVLIREHTFLDMEDETDLYGKIGRSPVTLLDYISNKYGWKWEDFKYDIDLNFN